VLWADTRSSAQLAHYRALDEEVHLRLGNPYVTGMAGPSLLWLRQHEPDAYSEARWAL
jgi:xylulokinase